MKLGWTILSMPDVPATLGFHEAAFGLQRRFLDPGGQYGELATGETVLAFAANTMAEANGVTIRPNTPDSPAAGFELCLVAEDPAAAYAHAVAAGATPVQPVQRKPWGQRGGHVRDLNGCLVELCSALG